MTPTLPMSIRLAALAGAAVLATSAPASAASTHKTTARAEGAQLQSILSRATRSPKTGFPGVALYVRRGDHRAWSGAAGRSNVTTGRRMRPGDRFRAGSIMKPFIATATLQLVEEGRFGLDDPLPAVLPASVLARFGDADRITVRMLLNHTSGLGEYTTPAFDREVLADPRRRWTVDEFLDRAAAAPRAGAPGERHAYANANYNLLGLIIERSTGQPWRTVVRERVLQPLHLSHTSLPEPGTKVSTRGTAHGYERVGGRLVDVTDIDTSMADAAGGHALRTTTADLVTFNRALLAGRLFQRRETLDAMRTFVTAPEPTGKAGYGLGYERYVLPGGVEMIGHLGTTGGYRAFMFRLPAQDIDFAMVTTTPDDPMPVLAPMLKVLLG